MERACILEKTARALPPSSPVFFAVHPFKGAVFLYIFPGESYHILRYIDCLGIGVRKASRMHSVEEKILIGMHRNVREMDRITTKIAAEYKLSFSQFMVLEVLYSKGDMSIGEVRERILSSVGTIPVIIRNLEKMGYIERHPCETDRRISILHITDAGLDVIQKVAPLNHQRIDEYMSVLSPDEKGQLLLLMKKLGHQ